MDYGALLKTKTYTLRTVEVGTSSGKVMHLLS